MRSLCLEFRMPEAKKSESDVTFYVYKTARTMQQGIRRQSKRANAINVRGSVEVHSGIIALTTYIMKFPGTIYGKTIIWLNEEDLGAGAVAHEITHAVIFLYRKRLKQIAMMRADSAIVNEAHECLASNVEFLTRHFWNWWLDKEKT